ncbi:MAG: glycosyltransferase [Fuerstiella sp.]|nr:glycosyltransferase [Fuerstiella sp.]MCP4858871.1 glycosyltransferase [Fuerstiella sp.]
MDHSRNPGITVVIPTKNGAATLRECLSGWCSQTMAVHRIIVIDSGSTDQTPDIAAGCENVEVQGIAPEDFNHGATRNFGISLSETEITVLTVQDAIPTDANTLRRLSDCMKSARVAGVCGSQIVEARPECNPVDWFSPVSKPENRHYHFPSKDQFQQLPDTEKLAACSWDNVLAMYRTEVVADAVPFRRTSFGEDAFWAIDALSAGFELAYCPLARVHHYHHETADYAERRLLEELYLRYIAFEQDPRSVGFVRTNLTAINVLRKRRLGWKKSLFWARYNLVRNISYQRATRLFYEAIQQGRDAVDELVHSKCGLPSLGRASGVTVTASRAKA